MADDIRRRSACDRCHSQKLRCPRRPGQDICDRCSKARASCAYSPFRQKKLPQDTLGKSPSTTHSQSETIRSVKRKRATSQLQDIDINPDNFLGQTLFENEHTSDDTMLIPWLPEEFNDGYPSGDFDLSNNSHHTLDFDTTMPELPQWCISKENGILPLRRESSPMPLVESVMQPDVSPNGYHIKPYSSSIGRTISTVTSIPRLTSPCHQLVHQLSVLNIELYESAESMPPQSIHDHATPESKLRDYSKYSLEHLLTLTQTLIDIYPRFMNAFFGRPFPSSLRFSNTSNADTADGGTAFSFDESYSRNSSAQDAPPDPHKPSPDLSSVLLLISCHLRLVGIWEQLLKHMRVCAHQRGVAVTAGQKAANVSPPRLQIGSFTPPQSAASPMYAVMFSQFAIQLLQYATDLGTEIQGYQNRESQLGNFDIGNSTAALSLAAVHDVKIRSTEFRQEMGVLSESIMGSGYA